MCKAEPQREKLPKPLKVQKFWQGKEPFLVWQVSFKREDSSLKLYLMIDGRQDSKGVYLVDKKPENLNPAGIIVSQIRKKVKTAAVLSVKKKDGSKDILLSIGQKGQSPFGVLVEFTRPPVIHLLSGDHRVSESRVSSKGCFTKKKAVEGDFGGGIELLPQLLAAWQPSGAAGADSGAAGADSGAAGAEIVAAAKPAALPSYQKDVIRALKRRRKTIKKAQEKTHKNMPSKKDLEATEKKAQLLQRYAYMVKPDMILLELPSFLTGEEKDYQLDIDPDKKVGQQMEDLFKKLKKDKRKFSSSKDQLKTMAENLTTIENTIESLSHSMVTLEETGALRQRFGLKEASKKAVKKEQETKKPYTIYVLDGITLLVGKGPLENDILTKAAKASDYWLHAIGVTGSHIIVPSQKAFSSGLPERVKKWAAILAIHFSKVRGDQKGEVYVTKKQHIKKKKGMPAGLWRVERSESYYVSYSDQDLKEVLDAKALAPAPALRGKI